MLNGLGSHVRHMHNKVYMMYYVFVDGELCIGVLCIIYMWCIMYDLYMVY